MQIPDQQPAGGGPLPMPGTHHMSLDRASHVCRKRCIKHDYDKINTVTGINPLWLSLNCDLHSN